MKLKQLKDEDINKLRALAKDLVADKVSAIMEKRSDDPEQAGNEMVILVMALGYAIAVIGKNYFMKTATPEAWGKNVGEYIGGLVESLQEREDKSNEPKPAKKSAWDRS